MRKPLLTVLFTLIISLSYAQMIQIQKYPPLIKEDVNFTELSEMYSKDAISENFIFYKASTTAPITVKNEIEERFILKNYSLQKMFPDKSKGALELSKVLFDTLTMRVPKSDEEQNFIYFEAKIDAKSIPPQICGTITSHLTFLNRNIYGTGSFANLHDISIKITSNLTDSKKYPIKLGNKCVVTTSFDNETKQNLFVIAIELSGAFQDVINSGNVILDMNIYKTRKTSITKKDVRNDVNIFGYQFHVLAFENGVVHLACNTKYKTSASNQMIGEINDNHFQIRADPISVVLAAYSKYRDNPKLNFDEFIKDKKRAKNSIDVKEFNYQVLIYNIGYALDSLHFIDAKDLFPSHFKYNVAVSKGANSEYSFRTIARTKRAMDDTKGIDKFVESIKSYIRNNVKYPDYAQENKLTGTVAFTFEITPEGKIINVDFKNSPDKIFSDEILRVIRFAPNFKRADYGKENYNLSSSMAVVFKL